MLLDERKTKRMVKIVSIICALGFVGVLPVVLGLVIFGGSTSSDGTGQLINEAEAKVEANPNDLTAIVDLATLYRGAGRTQDAAVQFQKAIGIGPKTNDELQTLITGLSDNPGQKLAVLQTYTKAHPKDADAFFTYATTAEQVGELLTARLAYQRVVQIGPKGATLAKQAQAALDRLKDAPVPTQPPLPSPTQTGPATPATP